MLYQPPDLIVKPFHLGVADVTGCPKTLVSYCKEGYQIPLTPGLINSPARQIMLFGNAAEYAPEFPDSKIIYVNPLDFFDPVSNTEKIILPPHDTRDLSFAAGRQ